MVHMSLVHMSEKTGSAKLRRRKTISDTLINHSQGTDRDERWLEPRPLYEMGVNT